MTRRLFLLLIEFLSLSVPLTYLWMNGGRALYARLFTTLATPIFVLFGATQPPNGNRERFINWIPFLVLMVITPGLSRRRRWVGTALGLVGIFCGHLLFAWVAGQAPRAAGGGRTFESYSMVFPAYLASDSLPLVLWAIAASPFLREVYAHAVRRFSEPTSSDD